MLIFRFYMARLSCIDLGVILIIFYISIVDFHRWASINKLSMNEIIYIVKSIGWSCVMLSTKLTIDMN